MTKQILFLIGSTLFFSPISPNSLQDLTLNSVASIFKGPAFKVAEKIQNSIYDLQENYYWSTIPTHESFKEVVRHEAAHAVVAHKLGYKVKSISAYKTNNNVYGGLMKFDPDSKINNPFENLVDDTICILMAGGTETKTKFGNSYGTFSDNSKIKFKINYLKKQTNIFERTKSLFDISKHYSDAKFNKIKNKFHKKTKIMLLNSQEMIEKITIALEEKRKQNELEIELTEKEISVLFGDKKEEPTVLTVGIKNLR